MEKENLYDMQEAAAFLGLKKTYLYKLVFLKDIPHYKYGRRVLFDVGELKTWKLSRLTRIPSKGELESKAALHVATHPMRP